MLGRRQRLLQLTLSEQEWNSEGSWTRSRFDDSIWFSWSLFAGQFWLKFGWNFTLLPVVIR
jgi:hypothetical protein